ncbi:MAG: hypothetical protein K5821_05465 [Nitrobacter sp.]|uniref:hypothetical protein n=1 Tax=Nitrobacter sp. TaxID=29420 RepID=UPI002630F2A9|nr:hypothetical protein [Nitrobacter sp.]MCV0385866.1 hypothetical protein [Nitrobacter sp.]
MNIHVIRPGLAADSIPPQPAAQERRADKARQRVRKLREKAFEEIERLIAFLDASDGYTMDEREADYGDGRDADEEPNVDNEASGDDEPNFGWSDEEAARGRYPSLMGAEQ